MENIPDFFDLDNVEKPDVILHTTISTSAGDLNYVRVQEADDLPKPTEVLPDAVRVKPIRIEGNDASRDDAGAPLPFDTLPPSKEKKLKGPGAKLRSRPVTVGIDIAHAHVNLVKAALSRNKLSRNKFEILDYKRIPIPEHIRKGSKEFGDFFRSTVGPFCEHAGKKMEVWAIISTTQAHVQFVRIPKVSDKHFEAAVQWGLKKELPLDEKDYSFGYEIQDEVAAGGDKKNNVLCYFAPAREIEETKELFSGIGVPLSGISIVPFAVQNIFKHDVARLKEKQLACLFIGDDHSRIDLYAGGKLVLTRDIKTGINSLTEMLTENLHGINGDARFSHDEARKILFALSSGDRGPLGLESGQKFNREDVEKLIAPVMERFTRQMERTFKHFEGTQGHGRVEKIYISSLMPCQAMAGHFGRHLGVGCVFFDPLKEVLQESSLEDRTALVPAFGLALSDKTYTPNFIRSYKERKKAEYIASFNRMIILALAGSLLVCSAIAAHEWRGATREKAELSRLEKQLQKSRPISEKTIARMASASNMKARAYAKLSGRYTGIALIGDLSSLTPASVTLTSLKASLSGKSGTANDTKNAASGTAENSAVVTGVVRGNRDMLEPELASYVMGLRSSPLFSGVNVQAGKIERTGHGAVLPFELDLKIGQGK